MGEVCVTTLNWTGVATVGRRLVQLIPDNVQSEFTEEGKIASLSLRIEESSIEALRIKVDGLLALFAEEESQ